MSSDETPLRPVPGWRYPNLGEEPESRPAAQRQKFLPVPDEAQPGATWKRLRAAGHAAEMDAIADNRYAFPMLTIWIVDAFMRRAETTDKPFDLAAYDEAVLAVVRDFISDRLGFTSIAESAAANMQRAMLKVFSEAVDPSQRDDSR
jgi:hypothetical protein